MLKVRHLQGKRRHALLEEHKVGWKIEKEGQSVEKKSKELLHSTERQQKRRLFDTTRIYVINGDMRTYSETIIIVQKITERITKWAVPLASGRTTVSCNSPYIGEIVAQVVGLANLGTWKIQILVLPATKQLKSCKKDEGLRRCQLHTHIVYCRW